ncbi:MAG: 50S ribosomal protein L9 [Candidatus Omnitrophica bacterium]|nr:50S ribosomal protein L9 [Candidatus Omnitrophota bacterium]MCF7894870.1 50S ribosomal protein L9 [Candidatus Omnitrophota bacterium]
MKVILLDNNVEKLGKEGDLVEVKDGYGRNYLIPNKLALPATKANLKKVEQLKKERVKKEKKQKQGLIALKDKLDGLSLTVATEAKEDDSLYGSIGEAQIIKLVKEKEKIEILKSKLFLKEPINKLGVYKIPVKIDKDLEANLRLWVVKK